MSERVRLQEKMLSEVWGTDRKSDDR